MTRRERTLSGFGERGTGLQIQGLSPTGYGQSYPQYYPQSGTGSNEPLGAPLGIREVARLIGCSPWTVRQRYLPHGLPHLRSGPHGKLIFFRDQIVRWVLEYQKKGGTTK
jgi:hypothetical protein